MLEGFSATEADAPSAPFFLATHFFGCFWSYILPDRFFDLYDPDDPPRRGVAHRGLLG